ncbi:hypothetical protein C8Q76DRAFT_784602 [Earliella scabrosa]|nr:hypothetical protein C8Q76DRAFT_784602 [Earliella scabrosa]
MLHECAATERAMAKQGVSPLVLASVRNFQLQSYLKVAGAGIYLYEYAITFRREVEIFWNRKVTVASVLFVANRYLPMIVISLGLPNDVPVESCAGLTYTSCILELLQLLPWAVFSALRAYVLSSRAWPIALAVFLLSICPLIINYVRVGNSVFRHDGIQCGPSSTLPDVIERMFSIVAPSTIVVSDILVLWITWKGTYKMSRELRALGHNVSLSDVLFRDGILCFVVIVTVNSLHLALSLLSITTDRTFARSSTVKNVTTPVIDIVISRFLMNLQEANSNMARQKALSSIATLDFDRFIGPLAIGTSLPAPSFYINSDDQDTLEAREEDDQAEEVAVAYHIA